MQFAVQLLFLLLQSADPPLKRLHLLPSSSFPLLVLSDGAAVCEAAVGGVGEADEGEMLTSETGVRHWWADVLQETLSVRLFAFLSVYLFVGRSQGHEEELGKT